MITVPYENPPLLLFCTLCSCLLDRFLEVSRLAKGYAHATLCWCAHVPTHTHCTATPRVAATGIQTAAQTNERLSPGSKAPQPLGPSESVGVRKCSEEQEGAGCSGEDDKWWQ